MATNSPFGLNRGRSLVLFVAILFLCSLVSSAQGRRYGSVSGTVIDFATKAPIENTIIVHLGSRLRTIAPSPLTCGKFCRQRNLIGYCGVQKQLQAVDI
jgi:hypothetical protein